DACRDSGFAQQLRRDVSSRSPIGRGLASVEPDPGTLVVYAAKHSSVALDGDDVNSPFASAFDRYLVEPGLEINKLFRLVRDEVASKTNHAQVPYEYGSLPAKDIYFVEPAEVVKQIYSHAPEPSRVNAGAPELPRKGKTQSPSKRTTKSRLLP